MRKQSLGSSVMAFIVIALGGVLQAQREARPVAQQLETYRATGSFVELDLLFEVQDPMLKMLHSGYVSDQTYLEIDRGLITSVYSTSPGLLRLNINTRSANVTLELFRKNIFSDTYVLSTSEGPGVHRSDMAFYRGIIAGEPNSVAVVSFIGDEVRILFADDQGNKRIQKTEGQRYVLFSDTDLALQESYECFVDDAAMAPPDEGTGHEQRSSSVGDCVEIYFECDLESYEDNGSSIPNTEAWVAALFNEVSTLYDNENVPIGISEIFIWTTPDPYINLNSTSAALSEFVSQTQQNGYNGRLAHLLSTRGLGGGIAYVNVLCSTTIPCAVSASLNTNVTAFPNYSWNITVISHEMGHNFGSRHTHRCWWNGNSTQIDDCGNEWANNNNNTPEGAACYDENNPILPTGTGGTIMSYCHLISGVGINFNNGFGPQPGDLLYDKFTGAPCNTGSCGAPPCSDLMSPATGSINVDINQDIEWEDIFGANGYILNIGTTSGGGQIVNNVDVGDVTTYEPGELPSSDQIFVLITPYNLAGNATGCTTQFFTTEPGGPPQCTQLVSPLNGSTEIGLDEDLVWQHSIGNQLGYKINVGLTPGGGELINNMDVGNVTTFDPGTFPLDEDIYVQIIPYGTTGDITGCTIESFTTISNLIYCASQGNIITDEWIASFSLGDFTNNSGASNYTDYTSLTIDAAIGETYNLSMAPGFSGQTWNEYFRVWIDFNKDGDFDDPDELIFEDGPTTTPVSGTFTVPVTALNGNTVLRVSMKYNALPGSCETFTYGEVEDYKIDIGCNVVTTTAESGPGSLIYSVGCVSPGDTIYFSNGLSGQTILLFNNVVSLSGNMTLLANAVDNISIHGVTTSRVFDIAPNGNVVIQGLTILAGTASIGGGVRNAGILTLRDATIQQHPGSGGKAVLSSTGQLLLEGNCTIEDP